MGMSLTDQTAPAQHLLFLARHIMASYVKYAMDVRGSLHAERERLRQQ